MERAKDEAEEPLLTESFDKCDFSQGWNGSFVRSELYPRGTGPFASFAGHGCVLHQYIPDNSNETTSAQAGVEGSAAFAQITGMPFVDEFYIEWQEYFPEDHDFADGSQKMMRFTYYEPGEEDGSEINLTTQNENTNIQLFLYHPRGSDGEAIDLFVNTGIAIPTGRWVTFAVWAKLNSPGENDGFARAYMDGVEIAALEDISNRGWDTRGWNIMWVGGNHTNDSETTQASSRYLDNIRWYAAKPDVDLLAREQ